MSRLSIRKVADKDREWIKNFIVESWGADFIFDAGKKKFPHKLEGFIVFDGSDKAGLLTYEITENTCEIVTIDSLIQQKGIGTLMIDTLKKEGQKNHWKRIWLITTNDNLNALKFYQKRGFGLVKINRDAVTRTRDTIKPEIPLLGEHNIPIRDEIELDYKIS